MTREDATRLDLLYRRYHGRVNQIARSRTRDPHAAEDVAGETWARAAEWLPSLKADDDHAGGWLTVITRRAAVDYYRPLRSTERPTDWADATSSRRLPSSWSAEAEALAVGFALERLRRTYAGGAK